MKYPISLCIASFALITNSILGDVQVQEPQKINSTLKSMWVEKITLEGHTYFHFTGGFTTSDVVIHDPECDRCNSDEDVKEFINILKQAFPQQDMSHFTDGMIEEMKRQFHEFQVNESITKIKYSKKEKKKNDK